MVPLIVWHETRSVDITVTGSKLLITQLQGCRSRRTASFSCKPILNSCHCRWTPPQHFAMSQWWLSPLWEGTYHIVSGWTYLCEDGVYEISGEGWLPVLESPFNTTIFPSLRKNPRWVSSRLCTIILHYKWSIWVFPWESPQTTLPITRYHGGISRAHLEVCICSNVC